jgi:hypothetical protein
VHDSIYHPFDLSGHRHMEYVHQRGSFDDLPLEQILASFKEVYGGMLGSDAGKGDLQAGDFLADVAREADADPNAGLSV